MGFLRDSFHGKYPKLNIHPHPKPAWGRQDNSHAFNLYREEGLSLPFSSETRLAATGRPGEDTPKAAMVFMGTGH
ncbi:hypothetical protein [Chromobacterium phragmitis]|uniref:Uncharacterized protein n=1 Tax=Chromobacterium phragmitis TaxID=2202141 RepID=A0ABV0ISD9_9NEIS